MDRRKARTLKIGDKVIGHKVGIWTPAKITGIVHTHADSKAKVPLFNIEGHPHPVTYRHLEIPS